MLTMQSLWLMKPLQEITFRNESALCLNNGNFTDNENMSLHTQKKPEAQLRLSYAAPGARALDTLIESQVLYQLS